MEPVERRLLCTPLSGLPSRQITWLLPNLLGKRVPKSAITIVGGKPGAGKSSWTMAVAAELTRQGESVLFVGAEDGIEDTVRPRLLAAGGDPSLMFAVTIKEGEHDDQVMLPTDVELIEYAQRQTGAALLIVDPIGGHLSPDINSHSDQSLRRALIPLATMTRRRGIATIAVMHQRKAQEGAALDSLNGGTAFGGVARSVLLFCRFKEGGGPAAARVLFHVKVNGAPLAPPLVTHLTEGVIQEGDQMIRTSLVSIVGVADETIQFRDLQ